MLRSSVAAGLGLVALAVLAEASVLVVAPSGAPYTQIQPAIDAAVDGDTILVKAGNYPGFTLDAKSLAVVADVEDSVQLTSLTRIENLGPGQCATLTGRSARSSRARGFASG